MATTETGLELLGRTAPEPEPVEPRTTAAAPAPRGGFAVVDVETTGLSPRRDRVVSVAVIQLDRQGNVQDEWSTLIDPQGPVGATHIHGITQQDVVGAPIFGEVVPHLLPLFEGRVLAGHNMSFDSSFLKYEFGRAGWGWPTVPMLCTLRESQHFLPYLDRRRLTDCCWACDIELVDAHSALGDARATAALLSHYLVGGTGIAPLSAHRALVDLASRTTWPQRAGDGHLFDADEPRRPLTARARSVIRRAPAAHPTLLESFTLSDAIEAGAPDEALPYLETLVAALEDVQITEEERIALDHIAEANGLEDTEVAAAHRGLLQALAREAVEDGVLRAAERTELRSTAELLDVTESDLKRFLDVEQSARITALSRDLAPLPSNWELGDPLRVGSRVVFTGCDEDERNRLEQQALSAGVAIGSTVSGRTAMLITDGSVSGTKAAAAARLGTRVVSPTEFGTLLRHIQPPLGSGTPTGHDMVSTPASAARGHVVAPAIVRAWALAQGLEVGVRGRIPAEVRVAYAAHHPAD
ncbi:exonuclease domain-containing protein [Cellulomonas fimi]|uniref:exonuclease domain-containing protein n=1 Tax=Cellulomonas sp. RIT-PI-Y TaxID=3035297 RepID=UPI0021D7F993